MAINCGINLDYAIQRNVPKSKGDQYVSVTQSALSLLGEEDAWLKTILIIKVMESRYEWVILLDADTRVSNPPHPSIHHLAETNKSSLRLRKL